MEELLDFAGGTEQYLGELLECRKRLLENLAFHRSKLGQRFFQRERTRRSLSLDEFAPGSRDFHQRHPAVDGIVFALHQFQFLQRVDDFGQRGGGNALEVGEYTHANRFALLNTKED